MSRLLRVYTAEQRGRGVKFPAKYNCKKSHDETSPSCTEDLPPRIFEDYVEEDTMSDL